MCQLVGSVKNLFAKSFCRSLDPKGRLLLPPEYRDVLTQENASGSFVLTGRDGYLVGYRPEQWREIENALLKITNPSANLNIFLAKFLGRAEELTPDGQGRVRIPQPLLREAALTKDVQIVGMLRTFQIWDQSRFDAMQAQDVSGELATLGIQLPL